MKYINLIKVFFWLTTTFGENKMQVIKCYSNNALHGDYLMIIEANCFAMHELYSNYDDKV